MAADDYKALIAGVKAAGRGVRNTRGNGREPVKRTGDSVLNKSPMAW